MFIIMVFHTSVRTRLHKIQESPFIKLFFVVGLTAAVVAGLASGIIFVALVSSFFLQANITSILEEEYRARSPGRIADKAVEIAMRDTTLQQIFEGREMSIMSIRDWGVAGGPECPIAWCAIILLDDPSDDLTGFVGATVSVKHGRVADFSFFQDVLFKRAGETEEARYFLSKYPDAQVSVERDGNRATVAYTAARHVGDPIDNVERKRVLSVIYDKSDLMAEPVEIRLYCVNGMSAPAIGDIIGHIDNEGCFGGP